MRRLTEKDYHQHLIDEGVDESIIEDHVGEGWTVKAYYEAKLEDGEVQPI